MPQTVTNFRYPNDISITGTANPPRQVAYGGSPAGVPGAPAIFVQDVRTGQITWNAPVAVGNYNVAMVVEAWRRTPLGVRRIGEVIRDMQITITAASNLRPTITIPEDICVIAGQTVTATDATGPGSTAATAVTLFAYSGIIPPATFRQSALGPPQARGTFTWQTQCNDVARLPYLNSSPVRRVRFQAFNRWGVKVFENVTTSADRVLINWNGSGYATEAGAGTRAVDGIYYYLAEVEFADFGNTRRTYKAWVEIVR